MGNRSFSFKRLSEETSPPVKFEFSDLQSTTSVEMEPLQQVNGNNKWHKTYTRLGSQTKGWTCRRFKPWLVIVACCLIISIGIVLSAGYVGFKFADHSFATKQDILELRFLVNESIDRLHQQLNDQIGHKGCNDSNTPHLHDQVSVINERMKSMQSTDAILSDHIDAIQRNLSDLSKLAHSLQTNIDTIPRKDSLLELDGDSARSNVTTLTKKIDRLQELAANLSSAQLDLESGVNQFHTNLTSLVARVQNSVSSVRDSQEHLLEKVISLQLNISQLGSQLNAIRQQALSSTQGDTSAISNRLDQLENQINSLSGQIHSPVNLYKNCKEDITSCSIDPDHSHTDYWRDCPTEYLPLHKQVHYILRLIPNHLTFLLLVLRSLQSFFSLN